MNSNILFVFMLVACGFAGLAAYKGDSEFFATNFSAALVLGAMALASKD